MSSRGSDHDPVQPDDDVSTHEPGGQGKGTTLAAPELPPEEAAEQADPPVLRADALRWGPDSPWIETGPPPEETDRPPDRALARPEASPPDSPGTPTRSAPPLPGDGGRRLSPVTVGGLAAIGVVAVMSGAVMVMSLWGQDGSDPASEQADAPTDVSQLGEGATLVVGPTGVVGTWTGSEWQPRSEGDQPGAGFDFTIVGLDGSVTTATGESVAESCAGPGPMSQRDVSVPLDPEDGGSPSPTAVAGVDDPLPRPVERLDSGSETYRKAATDVARYLGAETPAASTQVLRTDLDGGGTNEVVVAAEHRSDLGGSASVGDWSIVLLRRLVADEVSTDVLVASVVERPGDPLDRSRVSAIADLNGDGSLEVVLSGQSPSEEWTAIQAFGEVGESGGLSEVLRVSCET